MGGRCEEMRGKQEKVEGCGYWRKKEGDRERQRQREREKINESWER